MNHNVRFTTLDGLRGLAALLVLCFHAQSASPLAVHGGYLAVDVFFALSGFVLAMTYEQRLSDGLSVARFMLLRIIRLYPMYLLGMLPFLLMGSVPPSAALMIPDLQFTGALYPGNIPMWSLFYELIVSLAFGLFAMRCDTKAIALILIGSGGWLCFQSLYLGVSFVRGTDWSDFIFGLSRTIFSFTMGVSIHRFGSKFSPQRRTTWLALLPFALLLFCLIENPASRQLWDIACVFILLPCIVWMGTIWEIPLPRLGAVLGDISYPLYCIHAPIIWAGLHGLPNLSWVIIFLMIGSWSLDRWIDRPARKALTALLRRQFSVNASPA